jgi:uncharacterized repeat protein (TIGR03803 family)
LGRLPSNRKRESRKGEISMNRNRHLGILGMALLVVTMLALALAPGAWAASKFKTLRKFRADRNGGKLCAGLVFDQTGVLYGTTFSGGNRKHCIIGCGVVFKLVPNGDGSWTESVLHSFNSTDGGGPVANLIFDAAGNLYGTTNWGGAYNYGTVFQLTPNRDGRWTESVLYSFNGMDGKGPAAGLIFDGAGNLYGTTSGGGVHGYGTIFQLSLSGDGSWTESVLHSFHSRDGRGPAGGVIFDAAGNLYGTTTKGGTYKLGTVFKLTSNGDGSWKESVLHSFNRRDGSAPRAGLIFDAGGSLYGTTYGGGSRYHGTVFRLTPNGDGSWTESVLHSFHGKDGSLPAAGVIFDTAGNLYGTTYVGGPLDGGTVFRLKPTKKGGWKETVLYSFKYVAQSNPAAGLISDRRRNLYGTTTGAARGTVFEVIP